MIIKNGEILAIDHIAHDNTLSGNGTSAKPVGLSQSTKDLIDSKVKKTDFETYKSSAANQISNINTKITTDESNFESYKASAANQINNINNKITADESNLESYKSSAHDEIARIDSSIAAVNAAKVDKTTFEAYQTNVANNFTAVNKRIDDVDAAKVNNTTFEQYQVDINNAFTAVDKRIDDVNAAKQNKGDYVSASDFNSYKSSAHNEIARVNGRIDTTNTNLENNYYDITETYNKTEVDKKFADFGGYKFRDADPENNNQPILNDGEKADPKAIYLTQPTGVKQYLQWICDEDHIDPPLWKCIGDTTMDLKDYAKTVDVVASAEANKDWAERTFETQTEFSAVIKGYYTKDEVNTELATKVNNTDFNAYKTEVDSKFTNTSAWANEKFATKQNLTDTKAELEDTIESVSGEIISKINTDYGILDGKIDDVANTLSNDYYTSLEIDARLAASGEYYTKTESDTKYAEKSVFNTAINELSSNKLDKSATANWDITEYTDGDNIKIVGHEISGKDWSNEIAAAVENKADKSELENYYTSNQIDNKFVTKTDFNNLDNEVGAIDNDLDTLSGKTVTVIKDSETVKAIRSTESDGTISYTLSAHDGKQADYLWKPTVNAAGDISWELALTGDTPDPANIKGPQGISGTPGKNGENGITPHIGNNNHWFIGDDDTGVSATGPQGPAGTNGTNGKDGKDGVSPTVTTATIDGGNRVTFTYGAGSTEYIDVMSGIPGLPGFSPTVVTGDAVTSDAHKNGGTTITVTDETGSQTFTAWNGNDGTMAGAPGITGHDGITARNTGTTYEIGLSSEFYTAITSVSSKLDESDFTTYTETTAPNTFQSKGNYASASDITDMATEAWVKEQGYLTQNDIAGKADKTELETVSGEIVDMIPSLNGYATEQYVQGASAEVTAWVNNQHYLTSVPSEYITETELSTELLEYQPKGNYLTEVATSGSIIGTGLATNKIGLVTSAENALAAVNGKLNTSDVLTAADNILTGIKIGSTNYTIPNDYAKQTGNYQNLSAGSATSAYSAYSASYATTAASAYIDAGTISAMSDIVDELHEKLDSTVAATTYQTKVDMSAYVAITGDQMTGELELVGSNYDEYYMKATRTGINGHARFGMGGAGGAVIKADDGTNNAQMVLKANATSGIEILLQHNSNQTIGNLIPMVVESAGWVPTGNDYKLHIVLDS